MMYKTDTDDALARKIYRIAAERMQAAGKTMPCSEEMHLALTFAAPDAVSYPMLAALDNAEFLETAFLLLLQRPIDEAAQTAWSARLELPQAEFRTALLRSILRSPEYQKHAVPLLECPLPVADDTPQVSVQIAGPAMPERLVRIYQKMPRPMQKLAKKIAGRGNA